VLQLFHLGTPIIPCDLIGFLQPLHNVGRGNIREVTHHEELMSSLFAQANALAFGKDDPLPHKRVPGNRPSSTLLLEKLTPFTAGMLLAWTEHRAAVKGFIWGINSFDQFGVELGKVLGVQVREEILKRHQDPSYKLKTGNPSTDLMLEAFMRGKLPD
jgi:glucose-6-phosphate isomerase